MRLRHNLKQSGLIAGILMLAVFGFSHTARASTELIDSFDSKITIQKDGKILVTEKIIYNFGTNQRHGIFRDIPLTAKNGPNLSIGVFDVVNEAGESYQYSDSITNDTYHIKIGDPNAFVTGLKTYFISYYVHNSIRTFKDHDELYWNVTGNQWPVAIGSVVALVTSPGPSIFKADCFTGTTGSTAKNCLFSSTGFNTTFTSTKSLQVGEGLTVVLGIPPGYIQNTYVEPARSSSGGAFASFFPIFFAILVVIVRLGVAGRINRTKPKPVIPRELKNQPVVTEYNPPDNLPPIEIGTILDRRVDITDISSVIMDLAVRGYIKIRYTVKQIKFWPDKKDFELIMLKDGSDLVHPADQIMFDLLFSGRESVSLSDLQSSKSFFQSKIKRIQTETVQHLHDEGYFDKTAEEKPLAIVLSLLIGQMAHKLSKQGMGALAKILGFKEFLEMTEKDKLAFLNAPELEPEIFERFLPYAMVLGVEEKWAKKFEGIYNTMPNWYEDPTAMSFNSFVLMNNLSMFNGSFNQVFNITTPKSSSGFSGGFSGGGSGGGGGGSW